MSESTVDLRGKLARMDVHQANFLAVEGEVHSEMMIMPGDETKGPIESQVTRICYQNKKISSRQHISR